VFRALTNPATKAPSNTVRDALNGSAELISLTRTGMRARPSRARVDFEALLSLNKALALAQHPAREFLTEAHTFASVEVWGVLPHSVSATRKFTRVRESIGKRDHYTDN
jgi:hypothetical protein